MLFFSTVLFYPPCTGDPRSAYSLTSPVSTFQNSTRMRLFVKSYTPDYHLIEVYQVPLGLAGRLSTTFIYDPEYMLYGFDICLPAGTYSLVFVVKSASSMSLHDLRMFYVFSFVTINQTDDVSCSPSDSATGESHSSYTCCVKSWLKIHGFTAVILMSVILIARFGSDKAVFI
jgi:hypothetical protein